MKYDKYIKEIDFDELKDIVLSRSGAATEIYLSLIYYMITQEKGHEMTYSIGSGIKFNLLPQIKELLNVNCETINILSFSNLDKTNIENVVDKKSAEIYIKSFHSTINEEAFNYSFDLIEKTKASIEKDNLDEKIKSFRQDNKNSKTQTINKI